MTTRILRSRKACRSHAAVGVTLFAIFASGAIGGSQAPATEPMGAEPSTISPEQVVADTLSHSPLLKMSSGEVDAASAREAQAVASGLPSLDLDARAAHYEGLEDWAFGPGVTIPAIPDRYSAAVRLSQPLYTGGRVRHLRKGAGFQKSAAEANRTAAEADLAFNALTGYWNWSKAFYSLRSLEAAVARMQAHAADMNNLRDAGLVTDNDALATEVLADRIRLRLEEARGQVDVARAYMAFLTGHALADGAMPKQAEAFTDLSIPAEAGLLATAKNNRPDRAAREMEAQASESLARASRGGLRPQVLLAAQYEYASPNSLDMPPVSEWKDDMYVGVAVSWNLLDWGLSRAKADEADARFAQAQLRLLQADEQIALEVREAVINLKNSIDRVAVVERAQKSAGRNLDSVTDLWKNGLARHSEVLDAHSKLTDTQTELAMARADVALARSALDHAVGMMGNAEGKESK